MIGRVADTRRSHVLTRSDDLIFITDKDSVSR